MRFNFRLQILLKGYEREKENAIKTLKLRDGENCAEMTENFNCELVKREDVENAHKFF